MARELGSSEAQASSGTAAFLPAILGGFKNQAQSQPEGLGGLLGRLDGGSLLDNVLSPEPTNVAQGNGVLGQIFGSKDVSRAVAQNAAVPAAQPAGTGGGLGGLFRSLTGAGGGATATTTAPGLASMLDLDGDGNPLDDIMKLVGRAAR